MDYMELAKEAFSIICTFIAAYVAYYYAIKQLHQKSVENIEYAKYQAVLQAHKSLYRLLRFTTDTENEDSILIWERPKDGGLEATYYFRKENIRKFMKELCCYSKSRHGKVEKWHEISTFTKQYDECPRVKGAARTKQHSSYCVRV